MRLVGGRREQTGVEHVHAGLGAVVDEVDTVDPQDLGTARERGAEIGGRRTRFGVGHHGAARRTAVEQGPGGAVTHLDAGLRQRLPGRGRVGEVELVLGLATGGELRRLERIEVADGAGITRRVQLGHLAVPKVGFIGPGSEPVLLVQQCSLPIRVRHIAVGVGPAARRDTAPCQGGRRRSPTAVGRAAAPTATGAQSCGQRSQRSQAAGASQSSCHGH